MFTAMLWFLLGVLVLLFSTNYLVRASVLLAHKLHLSPLIIGITVISLGTSLPELTVAVISSLNGDYGLALGNIMGANITNVLLVLAIAILIGSLRIGTTKSQRTLFALLGITLLFSLTHLINFSPLVSASLLIFSGLIFTVLEYRWGVDGSHHEDAKKIAKSKGRVNLKKTLFTLSLSLGGTTLGGLILVHSAEKLALLSGYSTTVLGLTLVSISTTLPELLTIIFSQHKGEEKLSLGTVIGSNIYNLAIIGGLISLVSEKVTITVLDWGWFFGAALILLVIVRVFKGKTIPRLAGLALIILFVAYLFTQTL